MDLKTLTIVSLLILVVMPFAASAAGNTSISVLPNYTKVLPGGTFTVDVYVTPGPNAVYAGQYDLIFNPAKLQATKQIQGTFLRQDNANTMVIENTIDNVLGKASYAETRFLVKNGVTNPGNMSSVTFHVSDQVHPGDIIPLELANIILSGTDANPIQNIVINNAIFIIPGLAFIPPRPSGLAPTQNNFWVNYTWASGAGNITNSYNVSHNGGWTNNTITFRNNTVGSHGWSNITVYAYNNSGAGQLSQNPATMDTQVANNVPVLGSIGSKIVTAGQFLTFTISATDADSDTLTNATNASKGTFTPSTGVFTWTPTGSDAGTYLWTFYSNDTFGGSDNETITVTVNAISTYIPPTPSGLITTQNNFWVNYTWTAGAGNITNSYNVSVNGKWINGTTATYNNTTLAPHDWSNITVFAYNNSGTGRLSLTSASNNTQVANNAPVLEHIGDKNVTVGQTLILTVHVSDNDSDPLTNSTNASNGSFYPSTGVYLWTPGESDVGTYLWTFISNDSYGGYDSETINVIVEKFNLSKYIDTKTGNISENVNLIAPSGNVTIILFKGTNATLNNITLTNISIDSTIQVNYSLTLGDKFIGENLSLGPEGARFNPDIQLRFNYTGVQLAAAGISASELRVKFYNNETKIWEEQTPYVLYPNGSDGYILANISHFSTYALIGVPLTPGNNNIDRGSSGGGGGGGGGGSSGENYTNIELGEKYDMPIYKDKVTSYRFTNAKNPIQYVNITGNVSTELITAMVEVLKGTSTLVKESAPGIVYKNTNVWIGTKSFATPRNIKNAVVRFRVETSWINSNNLAGGDVKLLRWDESKWVTIETFEKEKDSTFSYFEGQTIAFSPMAIAGIKETMTTSATPVVTVTAPAGVKETTVVLDGSEGPVMNWALIIGVLLAIGTVIVLYLKRKSL